MSFLNPVSEPVLRFKSTDAGAPQINYNARTAGDIKAVLKACLVTGYGSTASAGWAAQNELAHVIEFVSPSASMGGYRLGVDDTSAANTIWRDIREAGITKAMGNPVSKDGNAINKTHSGNGWDFLVTDRGFLFIENVFNTAINGIVSRVTYYGQQKISVTSVDNISWWCVGHTAPAVNGGMPTNFFDSSSVVDKYYSVGSTVGYKITSLTDLRHIGAIPKNSDFDLLENWYLSADRNIIAQQPAVKIFLRTGSAAESRNKEVLLNGRNHLQVWPTRGIADFNALDITSHAIFLIPLDYWEY